jgi:hypothetical protein
MTYSFEMLHLANVLEISNYAMHKNVTNIKHTSEYLELKRTIDCLLPMYQSFLTDGYDTTSLTILKNKIAATESLAQESGINLEYLEHFSVLLSQSYDYDSSNVVIKMKPNLHFPQISKILLQIFIENETLNFIKNNDLSPIVDMQKKYEKQKNVLESCKDAEFVKTQLEPFEKQLKSLKRKLLPQWKAYEEMKNKHQKLLDDFNSLSMPTEYKAMKP